jgi:hypothetical protein
VVELGLGVVDGWLVIVGRTAVLVGVKVIPTIGSSFFWQADVAVISRIEIRRKIKRRIVPCRPW